MTQAAAALAQGRLVNATMSVAPDLASAQTTVQMKYLLRPGGETIAPLSIVLFDSAELSILQAAVNGQIVHVDDLSGRGSHRTGVIRLGPSAARDSVPIDIVYTVRMRGDLTRERVQVPVLAVAWPPAEATPGTFFARLTPPAGFAAYDPLPSLLRETTNDVGARAYEASLQVVPSLFSFRLTEGHAPRLGLAGILDIAVLVLLAGFTWVGWRHFQAGD